MRTWPWRRIDNFRGPQIEFVVSELFGKCGLGNVLFATEPFGRLRALRAVVGFWGIETPDQAEHAINKIRDNSSQAR